MAEADSSEVGTLWCPAAGYSGTGGHFECAHLYSDITSTQILFPHRVFFFLTFKSSSSSQPAFYDAELQHDGVCKLRESAVA